jgi:cell fate (sporulation/competence/biofilm development) regulator YmcA (YheA/YmcA/DUF963 family)
MDYQVLFNTAVSLVFLLTGWVIRACYDAIKELKNDIREIEREMHIKYVSKDDFREDMGEIKNMLNAIFNKLDNKVDK